MIYVAVSLQSTIVEESHARAPDVSRLLPTSRFDLVLQPIRPINAGQYRFLPDPGPVERSETTVPCRPEKHLNEFSCFTAMHIGGIAIVDRPV